MQMKMNIKCSEMNNHNFSLRHKVYSKHFSKWGESRTDSKVVALLGPKATHYTRCVDQLSAEPVLFRQSSENALKLLINILSSRCRRCEVWTQRQDEMEVACPRSVKGQEIKKLLKSLSWRFKKGFWKKSQVTSVKTEKDKKKKKDNWKSNCQSCKLPFQGSFFSMK